MGRFMAGRANTLKGYTTVQMLTKGTIVELMGKTWEVSESIVKNSGIGRWDFSVDLLEVDKEGIFLYGYMKDVNPDMFDIKVL